MAENLVLSNVTTFTNDTTAVNTVNNNNTAITTAFQDVLSRSGVSPNQMIAPLDMNNNQIINLPPPTTINSPARLADVVTNPTVTVPPTGTSGHVVPFLDGNNTWSGTDTFNGAVTLAGTVTGNTSFTGSPTITGGSLNLSSSASNFPQIIETNSTNDTSPPFLIFQKDRATATVQNGDSVGSVFFKGFTNGNYRNTSSITSNVNGVPSGSNVPSNIVFLTSDTSGQLNKSVTITGGGVVGTGTNDNALAGNVGETITGTLVRASAIT